ncbi:MAG TPA: TetR/AcrR family transcriptional regulator [Verrucomicrobiae bacterium]|nr:TetR/AcrR family transcriptional regulator [Verrucomicrobiae bacterium]
MESEPRGPRPGQQRATAALAPPGRPGGAPLAGPAPVPARPEGAETRSHSGAEARILDGAARAFAATGYHGTAVPSIAAAAGVSVGLIYRYFTSKAELFLAVCARQAEGGIGARTAELAAIGDPRARLAAAVASFVADLTSGIWPSVEASAYAEAEQNPRIRELLSRRSDRVRAAAGLLLEDAIRRGDAPAGLAVGPLTLAIAMLFDGARLARVVAGDGFPADESAAAITALVGGALGWT